MRLELTEADLDRLEAEMDREALTADCGCAEKRVPDERWRAETGPDRMTVTSAVRAEWSRGNSPTAVRHESTAARATPRRPRRAGARFPLTDEAPIARLSPRLRDAVASALLTRTLDGRRDGRRVVVIASSAATGDFAREACARQALFFNVFGHFGPELVQRRPGERDGQST